MNENMFCYLDNLNGNDLNDGLTEENAFKTFNKAKNFIESTGSDGIIYLIGFIKLSKYELVISDNNINVVGTSKDSEIYYVDTFGDGTYYLQNINFYKIKISFGESRYNFHPKADNVNFYNCILIYSGCPFRHDKSNFYNCAFINSLSAIDYRHLQSDYRMGGIFANCVFNEKIYNANTGFVTAIQQPYNLLTPDVEFYLNENNKNDITIKEKGNPTLLNKNNSISDIGIYGGLFPYIFVDYKFLMRQNNQYYTIKSEYYSNGLFQPLTLEGGEQPNENDYENFGFDDVNDLLVPIQVGEETFKQYDKLDNEFEICMATDKETTV